MHKVTRGGAFAGRDNTGVQQIFYGPVGLNQPQVGVKTEALEEYTAVLSAQNEQQ
jgi:hypothetical protein